MRLADIVTAGMPALCQQYTLNRYQQRALSAITDCRTGALGSTVMHCLDCDTRQIRHRSCSHRSCPQCQHHSNGAWFERQRGKRLPANYFMVTFTLPAQIRPLAYANPKQVYNALFQTALSTLSTFAHNHPQLQGQIGACAVLHTHARKLNYHPHVHVIVPAIAVNPARKQFRRLKGDYLFKGSNLAEVFRARMLEQLNQMKLDIPAAMPAQWNVNCVFVGKGCRPSSTCPGISTAASSASVTSCTTIRTPLPSAIGRRTAASSDCKHYRSPTSSGVSSCRCFPKASAACATMVSCMPMRAVGCCFCNCS